MTTQNSWDYTKVIVHNMFFPLLVPDTTRTNPDINPTQLGTIDPNPDKSGHNPDIIRTQTLAKLLEERKIKLLCLPVKSQEYKDTLYGSSYTRTHYGQKTTISGVIISADDLLFVFWTDQPLEEKSIVYPTQTEMKRWWQVDKCYPQSGGVVVSCSPSPNSPDISD